MVRRKGERIEKEKRVAERQKQKDEEQLAFFNAKREAKPAITTIQKITREVAQTLERDYISKDNKIIKELER